MEEKISIAQRVTVTIDLTIIHPPDLDVSYEDVLNEMTYDFFEAPQHSDMGIWISDNGIWDYDLKTQFEMKHVTK